MIQITHLTPGRFGEPALEVRMVRGVSSYPSAFKWLLVAFALLCLAVSGTFAILGAGPVLGFAGLELILLFVLLRVAFRRAATEEGVKIAGDTTVVERRSAGGTYIAARLESYWLRIEPSLYGAQGILLRSRGARVAVGVGLPADEVRELASAMHNALHRVKNVPVPEQNERAAG
jgi:uncharacterized membrane protein